ncbi:MAG: thioredoxin-dependent thiol peroxidase [Candidatus Harrisonbacteria bacterium]|nr:thioredoxin-dependent thiol peroxidase [Candidatus Harrisonbacteria bacterium]
MKEGEVLPKNVSLQDEQGREVKLQDLLSQEFLVLYFYPKDNTPGCTVEAEGFRDSVTELKKLGVRVVGVSKDSVKSHAKFCEEKKLPFTLLSDPEHILIEKMDSWGEKTMMGQKYMGTSRNTFLIDQKGKVVKKWEKVTPATHVGEVVSFIKTLVKG